MKTFKLSKNTTLYVGFSQCNWDGISLTLLPTFLYSMFRPDEYGVSAHHQISFQWFNFSMDLVYLKTYPVEDDYFGNNDSNYYQS